MIGRVVWITGVSGAGKTTLASALTARLRDGGQPTILLDGDALRDVMSDARRPLGHDRATRLALARSYARLCALLAEQGLTVVIATISLFAEIHRWNRQNLPGYLEVYLDPDLDDVRRRDPKRIYRRAARGDLAQVAGLDLAIDVPADPHVRIRNPTAAPVEEVAATLVARIIEEGEPRGEG